MTNFNPNRKPDKLPYRPIAECYLIYGDKIVAQDAGHYLSLPGGGIDKGESPEQAAVRELLEEVGAKLISKPKIISVMQWDWNPSWANTPKRKGRYMKFRGEEVYSILGVVDKFIKPTDVDKDAWTGAKLMSFKKATDTMDRMLQKHTPANQYTYNMTKLNIISTINAINSKNLLDVF